MTPGGDDFSRCVNCRIGSLEISGRSGVDGLCVNCRIGSLEIAPLGIATYSKVNCRIGSLEMISSEFHCTSTR